MCVFGVTRRKPEAIWSYVNARIQHLLLEDVVSGLQLPWMMGVAERG